MNNQQRNDSESITIVVSTPFAAASTAVTLLVGLCSLLLSVLTYRQTQTQTNTAVHSFKPATLLTAKQNQLHDILDNAFNDLELRDICFDLGVAYEDLPFSGQTHKARELVALCTRNGRLDALCQSIRARRPHLKSQLDRLNTPTAAAISPTILERKFNQRITA